MAIKFADLPYDPDAFEPAISAETFSYHHGRHYKTYVDNVNKAIAGAALADTSLETIIEESRSGDQKLFNSAAQSWNHAFFWQCLSPEAQKPSGKLAEAIKVTFGSLDGLTEQLAKRGAGHFASGWVWLAARNGELSILETHDAETLADSAALPLLTIDVWEHAYYIDHRNDRAKYLKEVLKAHFAWDFVSALFEKGERWRYPA